MEKKISKVNNIRGFSINIISLISGQIVIALISLINSVVIARALGVEDRGFFVMAMLLPNILITFSDFGIGAASTKFTASKKYLSSNILLSNSVLVLIRLCLISIIGILIVHFYSESLFPGIPKNYLYLGLLQALALGIQGSIFPIFLGLGLGVRYSLILVFSAFLSLTVFTICWLTIGLSVRLALLVQFGTSFIVTIYIYINLFNIINEKGKISLTYIKDAFKFGSGVFVSIISTFANEKMILLVLNFFGGVIYVSLYTLAQSLTERIYLLSDAVGTMLMPKISEDPESNSSFITPTVFKITIVVTFFIALILAIFANSIVTLMYTEEFAGSIIIMQFLLVAVIFSSGWRVISQDLNGRGLTKFTAMINVMLVIISLSLAIILLPKIGLVGAAIGSIIAYVFASLIGVIFFVRNTDKIKFIMMFSFSKHEVLIFKKLFKSLFIRSNR